MDFQLLTEKHKERYARFCAFVKEHVEPFAGDWDRKQGVPLDVVRKCGQEGFLGGIIPAAQGGGGWDTPSFGLLNEAFGAASSSLCGLYTVQTMVAMTLVRWGSVDQQARFLPSMAKGEIIASFALTEPNVGSDIQAVQTTFVHQGAEDAEYVLNGTKKWITFSGLADIFLVFGKDTEGRSMSCIVRKGTPGVKVTPLKNMLGFRGAHLSQIEFDNCPVRLEDLVGKPGLVMSYVAPYGLHYGRISTAWSSLGLLRACVENSATYASRRYAFKVPIMDHGMIRRMVTDMVVDLEAARYLCFGAAVAEDNHLPDAMEKTLVAKLFSSQAASRASAGTVQIMGAAGCHEENTVARFYRNARIMEIIEGTSQVLQKALGKSFCQKFNRD